MEAPLTFWQAMALAIIQGITEFIPVSSSGHLVLARTFLGWSGQAGLAFDTVLHAGSLIALLLYFRRDLLAIIKSWLAFFKPGTSPTNAASGTHRMEFWLLATATMPAVVVGPFLKSTVESIVIRNSLVTGAAMIVTALLFATADRKQSETKTMTFRDALIIGCAQVISMLPGASRSGWTIGTGILRGHPRESAVRFSFLMAIPIIFGAILFQLKDIIRMAAMDIDAGIIITGFLISLFVSLGAIHFCIKFFRTHSFMIFTIYMAVLGTIACISSFAA